jgi:hypothetical protein
VGVGQKDRFDGLGERHGVERDAFFVLLAFPGLSLGLLSFHWENPSCGYSNT